MKFSVAAVASLFLADHALAFVAPQSPLHFTQQRTTSSSLNMAVDMPPAADSSAAPALVQKNAYGQPSDVRYSDFLRMVNDDKVEKVTFSADGTQLLGVDVDGTRLKIESLPNDPELLNSLTNHKVCLLNDLLDSWKLLCVSLMQCRAVLRCVRT